MADVVTEMTDNFNTKAGPLLAEGPANATRTLIIASIVQEEVPDQTDQELVAGIILKRLADGMPLDIDATVCYAKLLASPTSTAQACSLTALDFKIDSPYNTYLNKGLPPAPIGNPGTIRHHCRAPSPKFPLFILFDRPRDGKNNIRQDP